MMKDDEKWFLCKVYKECENMFIRHSGEAWANMQLAMDRKTPRDLINEEGFPMHYKRAWYLLEKWTNRGWYSYGVTLDLGWLEEEGMKKAEELINGNDREISNPCQGESGVQPEPTDRIT